MLLFRKKSERVPSSKQCNGVAVIVMVVIERFYTGIAAISKHGVSGLSPRLFQSIPAKLKTSRNAFETSAADPPR
jgi:hypothetical protein